MKLILSGNEAVARGCYEAGLHVATAYPGTPSTEILENIVQYSEILSEWNPNENNSVLYIGMKESEFIVLKDGLKFAHHQNKSEN